MGVLAAGSTPAFFGQVAAVVVAGAVIAFVCQRVGLVPIVGFLVTGVAIGPNATGVVTDREVVDAAAEIGVILLLFSIGLEFSLAKLAAIRRLIFVGGGLQVVLAIAVTTAVLLAVDVPWEAAVFTAMLVSLSSTAIVLKLLAARFETRAPHGQVALGLLLFQDLAIVAMVLVVPMLGGDGGDPLDLVWAFAKAIGIVVAVLVVARRLMPPVLEVVARTCSSEVFLLSVIGICFGTAYLTGLAGVSLSLGAFLAGLLVSESRFSDHAFGEIKPLEIMFSGVFFVSVGMLLDLEVLVDEPVLVATAVAGILVVKVVTTAVAVSVLRVGTATVVVSSLLLAQVGEFSFVLERVGRDAGLTPGDRGDDGIQAFIAAVVLLMVATPALAALGGVVRRRAAAAGHVPSSLGGPAHDDELDLDDHVIVAGYGSAAPAVIAELRRSGTPFVLTTLNPDGASVAESLKVPVVLGDASKIGLLERAGVRRARLLVIPDDEPETAARIAAVASAAVPGLLILVRTDGRDDVADMAMSGATHVVSGDQSAVDELARAVARIVAAPSPRPATWDVVRLDAEPDACAHVGEIRPVVPTSQGCEECLQAGDQWVHLRACMTCGHVGCCDVSPGKHATAHHAATGHPIMRSIEPGERWGWCYLDRTELGGGGEVTAGAPPATERALQEGHA